MDLHWVIDEINKNIGTSIEVGHNNVMRIEDAFFLSIKRAVDFQGQLFELEDAIFPNRELAHIAKIVNKDNEEFDHFEWMGLYERIRPNFVNVPSSYGSMSVTSDLHLEEHDTTITTSKVCTPIFTTDKYCTAMLVSGVSGSYVVGTVGKHTDVIRSKDPISETTVVFKYTANKGFILEGKYDFATTELFDSMCNAIDIGRYNKIVARTKIDMFMLAKLLHKRRDIMAMKHIRVNNKTPSQFVSGFLEMFAFDTRRNAVSSIIQACSESGERIPEWVAKHAHLLSSKKSKIDKTSYKFVTNIVESLFEVSFGDNIVRFIEKFGSRQYDVSRKTPAKDIVKVVRYLRSITGIDSVISDVGITSFENGLIDYVLNKENDNVVKINVGDFDIDGASIRFDFENNRAVIISNGEKHSKYSRCLVEPSKSNTKVKKNMTTVVPYIFKTEKSNKTAIYASYALAISRILGIPTEFKYSAETLQEKNITRTYFTSNIFNFSRAVIGDNFESCDIILTRDTEKTLLAEESGKPRIVLVEREEDADIVIRTRDLKQSKQNAMHRIRDYDASRIDIEAFVYMLNKIGETCLDMDDARYRFEDRDTLMKFVEEHYNFIMNRRLVSRLKF